MSVSLHPQTTYIFVHTVYAYFAIIIQYIVSIYTMSLSPPAAPIRGLFYNESVSISIINIFKSIIYL